MGPTAEGLTGGRPHRWPQASPEPCNRRSHGPPAPGQAGHRALRWAGQDQRPSPHDAIGTEPHRRPKVARGMGNQHGPQPLGGTQPATTPRGGPKGSGLAALPLGGPGRGAANRNPQPTRAPGRAPRHRVTPRRPSPRAGPPPAPLPSRRQGSGSRLPRRSPAGYYLRASARAGTDFPSGPPLSTTRPARTVRRAARAKGSGERATGTQPHPPPPRVREGQHNKRATGQTRQDDEELHAVAAAAIARTPRPS